ncbi:MAG: hypothetical protein QOH74_191 [Gaiellales bacterium]|nr:hypothetical protein [Gaiellales bacterium]
MGEHAEPEPETKPSDRHDVDRRSVDRRSVDWRKQGDRVVSVLAGLVRWIGLIFAAFLVLYVVFVVGSANQENGIVSFVKGWAESVSLGFKDLFQPSDPKLSVLVNYGIAAIFWLVVSGIVAKVIRRAGGQGGG